jgi:hypothetical protein
MKALSLWQPWASPCVTGAKGIETRGWPTRYRGPLLIHAAKRFDPSEISELATQPLWSGALWDAVGGRSIEGMGDELRQLLPFGALLGVVELVDCRPVESFPHDEIGAIRRPASKVASARYFWTERDMGNYAPGRFGWVLASPRRFATPIPYRGAQGLFDVPADVVAAALAAA